MKFLQKIIIVVAMYAVQPLSIAALPVAVDGQELPSLAPMLERVQKSVVSITSDLQRRAGNDRFNDSALFKQFFENQRSVLEIDF